VVKSGAACSGPRDFEEVQFFFFNVLDVLVSDEELERAQVGVPAIVARRLGDSDVTVRCEAAYHLGQMGKLAMPFVDDLAQVLLHDATWRARTWAARALACLPSSAAAVDALRRALGDGDVDVRFYARSALKTLGEIVDVSCEDAESAAVGVPSAPLAGRKPRILAVHGTPANSGVMRMQCAQLKAKLGREFEWIFVDSSKVWEPIPGSEDQLFKEPSDQEKMLAKGKPFLWWYDHGNNCYNCIDEGAKDLRRLIEESAPVDVVLCFSQGSNLVSLLLDALRRQRVQPSWSLSVFFCGGQIDFADYDFVRVSSVPTVKITSASADTYFPDGEPSLERWYSRLLELTHHDGHRFPHTQPRANEIYKQVADEIRKYCDAPDATIW